MPRKEQRNEKYASDGLSDQLTDVKIDHENDMAMDDLVEKLASKWGPYKMHTLPSPKDLYVVRGTRKEPR